MTIKKQHILGTINQCNQERRSKNKSCSCLTTIGIYYLHIQTPQKYSKNKNSSRLAGVQSLEGAGGMVSSLQFPNQTRSQNFSFKHQGYCFLQISLFIFAFYCFFSTIYDGFPVFYSNYIKEIDLFTLDFLKRSDT